MILTSKIKDLSLIYMLDQLDTFIRECELEGRLGPHQARLARVALSALRRSLTPESEPGTIDELKKLIDFIGLNSTMTDSSRSTYRSRLRSLLRDFEHAQSGGRRPVARRARQFSLFSPASMATATYDLPLPSGRRARLALPAEPTQAEVESMQKQLEALVELLTVQASASKGVGK